MYIYIYTCFYTYISKSISTSLSISNCAHICIGGIGPFSGAGRGTGSVVLLAEAHAQRAPLPPVAQAKVPQLPFEIFWARCKHICLCASLDPAQRGSTYPTPHGHPHGDVPPCAGRPEVHQLHAGEPPSSNLLPVRPPSERAPAQSGACRAGAANGCTKGGFAIWIDLVVTLGSPRHRPSTPSSWRSSSST